MSRPKPKVLIEVTNKVTYRTDQILHSEGVWSIFYDSIPINFKTSNYLVQYPGPKYRKVSFSNKGHAINLAKNYWPGPMTLKLNIQFKTDKFTVILMTGGSQIYP